MAVYLSKMAATMVGPNSSSFPLLHKEIPPTILAVIQAFTCISYVFNVRKRRYTL